MYFGNIFDDFKMRYGEECRRACFCGIPLVFFRRGKEVLGCALSAGGAVLLSPRADDRLIAQFSDNCDYLNCCAEDFPHRNDSKIIKFLADAEKYGLRPHGANLLVYHNTDLPRPFIPLFSCAVHGFCENAPSPRELIAHYPEREKNVLSLLSRTSRLTLLSGQNCSYIPLDGARVKIIISHIGERVHLKNFPTDSAMSDAARLLCSGELDGFGALLNRETEHLLSLNKNRRICRLFKTALRLGDAYGSGIFPDGGIFSIVENRRADTFMHNLGAEYAFRYGARPRFYVTNAADSGIEIPTRNRRS